MEIVRKEQNSLFLNNSEKRNRKKSFIFSPTKLNEKIEIDNNNTTTNVETLNLNAQQHKFLNITKIINLFLQQIYGAEEVSVESMGEIMEKFDSTLNFEKVFVDNLLAKFLENPQQKVQNLKNLHHLGNILNNISLHIDSPDNKHYVSNYSIIHIASKVYYEDNRGKTLNKNTVYLHTILSKNKLYSTRKFWIDLIDIKITKNIEGQVEELKSS